MLISSALQAQSLSIELVPTTYTGNYHVSCNGASNGSITANHENTNPPFTYLWSTDATTKSISGLQAGSYSVTVTDANSNTGTAQITLTQPNVLASEKVVSEYGPFQISVHSGTNGSISVTPTGGTSSYTILWNDNDDKFNRNGLAAGTYSYVITDANGCTAQGSSTLMQPDPLQLSFSNVTGVSCNGFEDGSAQLTITGGIAPYQILWDNGSFSENPVTLPAGLCEVHVTDVFENAETGQINSPEPDPLSIELQSPAYSNGFEVSCFDCFNGSISATVNGGTAPYSYVWDGAASGQTTANISNLNGGDYILLLTDAHNCTIEEAIKLKMPERQDWTMNGNAGTDPSTQFIGTTDSVDVVFKSNNAESLRIAANGNIGIGGITTPTESIETNGNIKSNGFVLGSGLMQRTGSGNTGTFYFDPDGTLLPPASFFTPPPCFSPGLNLGTSFSGGIQIRSRALQQASPLSLVMGIDNGTAAVIDAIDENANTGVPLFINSGCGGDVHVGKAGTGNLLVYNYFGIGTTTPASPLDIQTNDPVLSLSDINTPGTAPASIFHLSASNNAARLLSDGSFRIYLNSDNSANSTDDFIITKNGAYDGSSGSEQLFKIGSDGIGHIRELIVEEPLNGAFPDYVFEPDYSLLEYDALDKYIHSQKHLPNFPAVDAFCKENKGMGVSEFMLALLRSHEESVLYILNLHKRLAKAEHEIQTLKNK